MENLPSPWFLSSDKLVSALDSKTVLQMIAVADIGQYGALGRTIAYLRIPFNEVRKAVRREAHLAQRVGVTVEDVGEPASWCGSQPHPDRPSPTR